MKTKLTILLLIIWSLSFGQNTIRIPQPTTLTELSNTIIISNDVVYDLYNDDALSLFARMFPEPVDERKALISLTFDSLQYYYPDSIFAFWMIAADNVDNSLLEWYADSNNLSLIYTPDFAIDTGWVASGEDDALNTNYNPTYDSRFKQDSVSFHIYMRTSIQTVTAPLFGCEEGGNRTSIDITTTGIRGRINMTTAGSIICTTTSINGLLSILRVGDTQYLFRNGVQIAEKIDASSGIPNCDMQLIRTNWFGHTTNQISFFCIGNLKNPLKLNQIVEYYLDQLSSGVIE